MHSGRRTERDNDQQPEEWYKKLKIDNCKSCGTAHGWRKCLGFWKTCCVCGKQNHFKVVCRNSRRWAWAWPTPQLLRCMHEVHKEEEVMVPNWEKRNKSFESVSMKSLTFHSMKSIQYSELDLSTRQKRAKIVYETDTGSDGNIMPFWTFEVLLLRSTMAELNTTINRLIVLKTQNQSNIEQLGRCSLRIRPSDKCVTCRFLVEPGNGQALLRMSDVELLSIIRVMCETIDKKANDRNFNVQTTFCSRQPKLQYNQGTTYWLS